MSKIKKSLLFVTLGLGIKLLADPLGYTNQNLYYKIYQQGIYDTYKEINSLLVQNLTNSPLEALDHKIIVAVNINNLPINQILYLSVIGQKNFFNTFTAENKNDGNLYLIFGVYDRKADADYAINVLRNKNINAEEIFNGNWYNYNIILKDIIFKLKNGALRNYPVKVIVEKEIILKKEKNIKNQKTLYQNKPVSNSHTNNRLQKLFTLIGHLKINGMPYVNKNKVYIYYQGKLYGLGDYINGFKITQAYSKKAIIQNKPYNEYIFMFDDYKNYHLIYRVPVKKTNTCRCNSKKFQKTPKKNKKLISSTPKQNINKANITHTNNTTSKIKTISCNFNNIISFLVKKDNSIKTISVQNTPLANLNNVKCYWDGKLYTLTYPNGVKLQVYKITPINYQSIYIQPKDLENACNVNN